MLVAVLILAVGARQLAVLLAPLLPLRQGARRMAAQIAALLQVPSYFTSRICCKCT